MKVITLELGDATIRRLDEGVKRKGSPCTRESVVTVVLFSYLRRFKFEEKEK